jgi:glucose-1-phosphate thymidylyltransferase
MKGIILAGGLGTRLYPITQAISKQTIPIYDKPMIYYPMSVLMLAGIRDILIISSPRDIQSFRSLFGNGNHLGIKIEYKVQEKPNGLAEAFILGKDFIKKDNVCLILGDNIFYGQGFITHIEKGKNLQQGALIFGYYTNNPKAFGVIEFDQNNNVISIEEKPKKPKSKYIVPGLYFYDNTVVEKAKSLKPSKRNELEITDLNNLYIEEKTLKVDLLGRGMAWLDTGTKESILKASNFVESIQSTQGIYIACLEEIAYTNGWISKYKLHELIKFLGKTEYSKYLLNLVKRK